MECGDYDRGCASMARGPCAVGLQLRFGGERGVPLAVASRVPRKPARPVVLEPPPDARDASHVLPSDVPFMNDMDEISYWIHTKRAPCLMSLDNLIKKRNDEAQCSKHVNDEMLSPRKRKKKRKLSMLDDESGSTEKHNVFFEVAQRPNQPVKDNCKSDTLGSDVEFNIKNHSFGLKPKKVRSQKRSPAKIHKKTQVVTSTPKATVHLRRSLRQAKQSNVNAHFNNSFELFNAVVSNGHVTNNVCSNLKSSEKVNKSTQMFASGDQTTNKRNTSQRNKLKTTTHLNGQFEDLSDVSGFTANYIRSTKVQSSKAPRKLRCKSSRNLVKESQQGSQDDNVIVCVNKSMNTGVPKANVLNCSTDSSQNVMNLVTSKNNDKSEKMDKSTSLLKFVDTRVKSRGASNRTDCKLRSKSNLNVSFQSQSSGTSRYPKRYKHHTDVTNDRAKVNTRRRAVSKNCIEFNNSDKKENPEETTFSRTRSGRNVAHNVQQRENSVLVVSNSTEQVSSMVSMNVASPTLATQKRKKRRSMRQVRKKPGNKSGQSLRDKSGFAACFTESDDDSVPLMQRKYFCN